MIENCGGHVEVVCIKNSLSKINNAQKDIPCGESDHNEDVYFHENLLTYTISSHSDFIFDLSLLYKVPCIRIDGYITFIKKSS